MHQLADTVRNSLNFYRMQESAEPVEPRASSPARPSRSPASPRRSPSSCSCRVEAAVVASADDADAGRLTVAAGLAVDDAP